MIGGDFNAPHPSWGYPAATPKGRKLEEVVAQEGLSILTDPTYPTRLGNSVSRDTCPDLTFTKNIQNAIWKNTEQHLGSDHFILSLEISTNACKRKIGIARVTNWDRWRKAQASTANTITDLEEWVKDEVHSLKAFTKEVCTTEDCPAVDPHLLHLWEARHSLTKRWRRQRLNRKLKKKIEEINKKAESYAISLTRQNWHSLCDGIQGKLGVSKTWKLLRVLIDPSSSKSATKDRLTKIVHTTPGTDTELIEKLKTRYLCTDQVVEQPEYPGLPNPKLDLPLTKEEIKAEIAAMRKNAAPGPDQITAKLLFNLSDDTITALVECFNEQHWATGTLPISWKTAEVRFIPKANKPLKLDNLRPISLTSCLGKLIERVINTRLSRYLEENNLLPNTQFGFRPHLSTQDALLYLYKDLLETPPKSQTRAILALDLKGAFDNVLHKNILQSLADTNCGARTYNYIKNFLSVRQATINFGGIKSDPITLGPRGTPQGAVLSPLLFNLAMKDLPGLLSEIPGVKHTLYADDITVWCNSGSDAEIEERLQAAADTVDRYARERGLQCAPEKSELLILKNPRTPLAQNISVYIENHPVQKPTEIKILGQYIPQGRQNTTTMKKLTTSTEQILRMIHRIRNKHHGMKERDTIRLVQAFVISRIMYGTAFLNLSRSEIEKLEVLIRKAYKTALGLPNSTPTAKLMALGVHNTLKEMWEAQWFSQLNRLALTKPGRELLDKIHVNLPYTIDQREEVPRDVRRRINVHPIPRNMHPAYNTERRKARGESLQKKWDKQINTLYVDAAGPNNGVMTIVVSTPSGSMVNCASVKTSNPTHAEEAAIALAVASNPNAVVLTDSQNACRNFNNGLIHKSGLSLLTKHPPNQVSVIWFPGHLELPGGNEAAHRHARALLYRTSPPDDHEGCRDLIGLAVYADNLAPYRTARKEYPTPHKSLNKLEENTLRRLQTNTYPTPAKLHQWYPTLYSPQCPHCGAVANLYHMVWACQYNPLVDPIPNPSEEQWEAILLSDDPDRQHWLVGRASAAAAASGLPD